MVDSPDPIAKHRERVARAAQCFQRLSAKIPARKSELEARVQGVQRYARFREDGKHVLMLAYEVLRQTALEFGRRLGLGEKVFYLTPGEISAALHTGFVPEDRIERRMAERRIAGQFYTPRVIDRASLEDLGHPPIPEHAESYPAYPVSTGSGSGPAQVLHRPEDADVGATWLHPGLPEHRSVLDAGVPQGGGIGFGAGRNAFPWRHRGAGTGFARRGLGERHRALQGWGNAFHRRAIRRGGPVHSQPDHASVRPCLRRATGNARTARRRPWRR